MPALQALAYQYLKLSGKPLGDSRYIIRKAIKSGEAPEYFILKLILDQNNACK